MEAARSWVRVAWAIFVVDCLAQAGQVVGAEGGPDQFQAMSCQMASPCAREVMRG